jgi:hypothetical protein
MSALGLAEHFGSVVLLISTGVQFFAKCSGVGKAYLTLGHAVESEVNSPCGLDLQIQHCRM